MTGAAGRGVGSALFRELLGRFATGVAVLTTRTPDGALAGMTASSVSSVSLEPPLLSVCVDLDAEIHQPLFDTGTFVINILADDQEELSRRFAAKGADRFAGVGYRTVGDGLAVLDGVVAHIECRIHHTFPAGDHTIVVGRVVGGNVEEGRRPLIYYRGGYGGMTVT